MDCLSVPAIKVKQKENELFVFKMEAGTLLKLAQFNPREKDRKEGIQRPFSKKRSKEIRAYLENENAVLPNNIIINLELTKYEILKELDIGQDGKLNIPNIEGIAFIIDGQHRLKAFEDSNLLDFELVVSAFQNLSIAKVAEIFVSINFHQKPVNKSLVFDLLGISPHIYRRYYSYHNITEKFNSYIHSPWFDNIKMLGIGKGIISQATFIQAMEEHKILEELLNRIQNEDKQFAILWTYFEAIKKVLPKYWCNKKYILCKSVGYYAQIMLLPHVLNKTLWVTKSFKINEITHLLEPLGKINFEDPMIKSFVGKKGARNLYEEMLRMLNWSDL